MFSPAFLIIGASAGPRYHDVTSKLVQVLGLTLGSKARSRPVPVLVLGLHEPERNPHRVSCDDIDSSTVHLGNSKLPLFPGSLLLSISINQKTGSATP